MPDATADDAGKSAPGFFGGSFGFVIAGFVFYAWAERKRINSAPGFFGGSFGFVIAGFFFYAWAERRRAGAPPVSPV